VILDQVPVNAVAALRRLMRIGGIVVAMDIEQGALGHGHQKGEVRCFQIAAGNNQIVIFKLSRGVIVPQGSAFFIGNAKDFHRASASSFSLGIDSR
jgi:hypothetical protein